MDKREEERGIERKKTLAEHWVGKEWEVVLEGSLVLAGILEEARAAWLAIILMLLSSTLTNFYMYILGHGYNVNYGIHVHSM